METINVQKRDFNVKAKKMRRLGMIPGDVFGSSFARINIYSNGRSRCTQIDSPKT